MGRLFSIQIFDHSAAFDCRDILEAEKGILEVYQKRTFIKIDTNLRKFTAIFSDVVFKENAYYWENEKKFFLHITLNRCWNLKDFRDQVSNRLHTTFIANGDLNCCQNIMHTHLAIITTKRIKATKNHTCQNKGTYVSESQRLGMVLSTLYGEERVRLAGNNYGNNVVSQVSFNFLLILSHFVKPS